MAYGRFPEYLFHHIPPYKVLVYNQAEEDEHVTAGWQDHPYTEEEIAQIETTQVDPRVFPVNLKEPMGVDIDFTKEDIEKFALPLESERPAAAATSEPVGEKTACTDLAFDKNAFKMATVDLPLAKPEEKKKSKITIKNRPTSAEELI